MLVVKEYRRKPDPFQAVKVTPENVEAVAKWCGGEYSEDAKPGDPSDVAIKLKVPNVDGAKTVGNNGYVIKHANGRFYTCDSNSFLNEYEEVGVRETPKFNQPVSAAVDKDFDVDRNAAKLLTPHYVARGQHPFGN